MLFSQSSGEHRAPALSKQCLTGEGQSRRDRLGREQKMPSTKPFCVPVFAGISGPPSGDG